MDILTAGELAKILQVPGAARELEGIAAGGPVVVSADDASGVQLDHSQRATVETLPHPLVGVIHETPDTSVRSFLDALDVLVAEPGVDCAGLDAVQPEDGPHRAVDALARGVEASPLAAATLVLLLRGAGGRSVGEGLVAESAAYSLLQAGPEFREWLRARGAGAPHDDGDCVRVERAGRELRVTLTRPEVHNAFSARMREELLDALAVAAADPSIESIVLAGEGASFCSGGDLDEFGTAPDPATAHVVRLARSAGAALHGVAQRTTVHLHGACFGAGIELPAFASRVVARADTVIALPEVAMGLIPGAGGTVSLPRRIGRRRTAYLALSGDRLDAWTGKSWGVVDEVADA